MRLGDFEQTRVGDVVRYTAALTDDRGEQAYQLLLVGDEERINEAFGESDFDATISPYVDHDEWMAHAAQKLGLADLVLPPDAFDDLSALFEEPQPKPTSGNSVVCAIRRERPGGTGFALLVPFFVPAGRTVFFVFPPAFACTAAVLPISGNPNLFLNANSFTSPPIRTSAFGGLAPDSVSFTTSPFAQFFPIFGVPGALASAGTFAGASFGFP